MKIWDEVEKLIAAKNSEYGNLYENPTHDWLTKCFPDFRIASAVKHLISYKRTKKKIELVKACAYLALEWEAGGDENGKNQNN